METFKKIIEDLIDRGNYSKACNLVAEKFGIKLNIISRHYGFIEWDKETKREVFKLQLKRGRKSYTFDFGQSVACGSEEPTPYDVLACLQKYDVGTFEDFCSDYGYDEDSRTAEKTYKAVVKEYEAMSRLFTDEELDVLQSIN